MFVRALYLLLVLDVLGGVNGYFSLINTPIVLIIGQAIAWVVLLWGLGLELALLGGVFVAILVSSYIPFIPVLDLLMWGFLTAVPLSALAYARQRYLPILAGQRQINTLRSVSVQDGITQESIESQWPILECLEDGIVFSGQTGLTEYVNQAACLLIGLSQTDMIGQPISKILAHMSMKGTNQDRTNQSYFEMNGRILKGQVSLVYNRRGSVAGTVAILQDITAQHHAERVRDDFLTTISHELRTPLTAIKGYVELFKSGTGGAVTEQQKMFIGTIQRNVDKMVQLINSLLFASTIKGGRLEYTTGTTDLKQLIPQMGREAQAKAGNQKIEIHIDDNLDPIQADPMHMATIIEELLSNGIKYNKKGGTVQITAVLERDEAQKQSFAVVSVRDEGIGIAPSDQAHIFDDFYRPDSHESQVRAGGLGMGLPIVRALVEAYNGRIWFESSPQQGSTFTFLVPTHQPQRNTLSDFRK